MYSAGQLIKVTGNPGANLRATPSSSSDANIIEGVPNGTILPVVGDSQNAFANVTYQGSNGYVSEQYVVAATPQDVIAPKTIQPGGYRITGFSVNIRNGPSLNAGIMTETGPVGETFVALGNIENGYAQGSYTNASGEQFRGWIAEQYLGQGQDPASVVGRPALPVVSRPAPPIQQVANKPPPAGAPSGVVMAGGLLALALVIYFMAKCSMTARENFARMFGGAGGISDAGANWQPTPTHIFEPVRRVGEHHFGSPAMRKFLNEGLYIPDEGAGRSVNYNQDSGAPTLPRVQQTRAMSLAQSTIQKSDVDQYGNRLGVVDPPLGQGDPHPPEGERPPPQGEAPGGSGGTSTTTMLLLGGAAFVAVMLVMKGRKK